MFKKLFLALAFSAMHGICYSQTPNVVPMKLEPFPESNWYISLYGSYGRMNYETNTYIEDAVTVELSSFSGMEGDENAERAISILYKWGGSNYEIQVITDLGLSDKYKMKFVNPFATFDFPVEPDDEEVKKSRVFRAYAVVKGQPLGIRLFEMGKAEPFKEVRFYDPGEPPKLWFKETIFIPTGDIDEESGVYELDGEGYEADIISDTLMNDFTHISYDGGATWVRWSGLGSEVFRPEQLAKDPHPIIRVTAYSRMRRYVKYYTYKKGFSDEPGGPYEPITIPEPNNAAEPASQSSTVTTSKSNAKITKTTSSKDAKNTNKK